MKKLLLPLIFILLLAGCGNEKQSDAPQKKSPELTSLIGVTYPPMPEGLSKISGALATGSGVNPEDAMYSFMHAEIDSAECLILSEYVQRKPNGVIVWKITDALVLPEFKSGERLQLSECSYGQSAAAAILSGTSDEADIAAAWGVDRESGKLTALNPDSVSCRNAGLTK